MPLRTRIKRAFSRRSTDDGGPKKNPSKTPKVESNVYQPGEKMPPLKYRRPVAPEHKAKLESFNWANAWRRRSAHSIYSPMGSRMPSRKTSYSTLGRRSIGGRSVRSSGRKSSLRSEGIIGVDSGFGGSVDESRPDRVKEGSDEEGDVSNGEHPHFSIVSLTPD